MIQFVQQHGFEIAKLVIECVVLFLIFRELRALRSHHAALETHAHQLEAARPLMSTLYTDDGAIMDLAISFTEQADAIRALGTIASVAAIDRRADETIADHEQRLTSVDPRKRTYVSITLKRILEGCKYRRVLDFLPEFGDDSQRLEILSNIRFFLRAYDTPRTSPIDLELYHNPETLKGRGEFHFRCSDKQLVLRVGGHGNGYANAAIQLNDARVVEEFRKYFDSIVAGPASRRLSYDDLRALEVLLTGRDIEGAARLLATPAGFIPATATAHVSVGSGRGRHGLGETGVVLAAGRGTRMGEMGATRQKCLLEVGGKPLLGWVLESLAAQGVKRVLVLTGYRSQDIDQFMSTVRIGTKVETVKVNGLSTASALLEVRERLGDNFWFVHGNLLIPPSVLSKVADRYEAFTEQNGHPPAAALATVSTAENLTHACLRKTKRDEVRVVFAQKWNSGVSPGAEAELLSLGAGILNASKIRRDGANYESMMVEGLIDSAGDYPILSVRAPGFAHFETDADYRRWAGDPSGVHRLMEVSK